MKTMSLPHITNFAKSDEYRKKIHDLIPGGAHTYSKGDDQFPIKSPAAITHAKGVYCWDLDGNKFLDTLMGLYSVSLGHAYEPVLEAVKKQLEKGVNFTRPSVIEMEMAEKFLSLVPQHDMIKFAKNGSVATTAAIKLSRAYTGKHLIARPAEHPFYSYDDWFIGSTACDFGIPKEIKQFTITYKQDSLEDLERMFNEYPGQIACVISEPEKWNVLEPDFYKKAIDLAHKNGAMWIMDEMITGFKSDFPGSIKKFNAEPDFCTWGKGIANGFSFCALTGKKEIMEYGGIRRKGEPKVFLVSTTHGGETCSIGAALATMDEFEKHNVLAHNQAMGQLFIDKTKALFAEHKLENNLRNLQFNWHASIGYFDNEGNNSFGLRTLFHQELIKRGILFQGIFCPNYSHKEEHVNAIVEAMSDSLPIMKKALEEGWEKYLVGEPIKPVFRKYI